MMRPIGSALLLALLIIVVLSTGCSNKPKIVKVSGQVLIDGEPLRHGFVQIAPAGYRAASAKIGPDGRFTLTTSDTDDGVVLGTHPVAVIGFEILSPSSQKWHAPKKYASTDTSELTVNITGPTNDLKIELTWNGKAPFIERSEAE